MVDLTPLHTNVDDDDEEEGPCANCIWFGCFSLPDVTGTQSIITQCRNCSNNEPSDYRDDPCEMQCPVCTHDCRHTIHVSPAN